MRFAERFLAALCACVVGGSALAADAAIRPDRLTDRIALFAGGDIARQSYFVWAGAVGAPLGLLQEDGLRVRIMGGGGSYLRQSS